MSERFARLKTDPRFRKLKKHANKVEIDPRFKTLVEEKPNKRGARIDKYGRKITGSREKDILRGFYRLPEDGQPSMDYARGEGLVESSSEEEEEIPETDDDEEVVLGGDVNKPIAVLEEEAEIDLDESQFVALDAEAEGNLSRSQRDGASGKTTTKPTKRLAVVNLDWDHVKASHLFKIFSSQLSLPTSTEKNKNAASSRGRLLYVHIYPSEYGKKRMAEEDKWGPPAELFRNPKATKEDESDKEEVSAKPKQHNGDEYDQDALRRYQLERLRYYYAIATFDSTSAAAHAYTELEGTELERSANLFDLSYVPEDMDFDEKPHDEATHDAISFQPLDFTTDALRHSNVKLTWDDDDPERVRITRRNLSKKEIDEIDFKGLIASSDEEEEGDDTNPKDAQALRALLLNGNEENLPEGWGGTSRDKAGEMEITFTPGLSDNTKDGVKKGDDNEYETTLERYQRKEKEKKRAKKAAREEARKSRDDQDAPNAQSKTSKLDDEFFGEDSEEEDINPESANERKKGKKDKRRKGKHEEKATDIKSTTAATEAELSLLVDADSNARHFDMASIMRDERKAEKQKKRKREKREEGKGAGDEDAEIDLADPRFKSLHEDHRFAIDPANPHFKKTKSMKKLLQSKGNRGTNETKEREGKRQRRG